MENTKCTLFEDVNLKVLTEKEIKKERIKKERAEQTKDLIFYTKFWVYVMWSLPEIDIDKSLFHYKNILFTIWVVVFNPFSIICYLSIGMAVCLVLLGK